MHQSSLKVDKIDAAAKNYFKQENVNMSEK